MQLRPKQAELRGLVEQAWSRGVKNVLLVKPTGSGKTATFCSMLAGCPDYCIAIAHRHRLVEQMSLTLCRYGITHNIDATPKNVKRIVAAQLREFGRTYFSPSSKRVVASVDTIKARIKKHGPDAYARYKFWVIDEAHHVLRTNKWGQVVEAMPNARGLGVTATPDRADGCGLGAHASGVFDEMVVGPPARWYIEQGDLADYRIIAPRSQFRRDALVLNSSGAEFSDASIRNEVRRSRIWGDCVNAYRAHVPGLRAIVFVSDIETAQQTADRFNDSGIPAAPISSKTPEAEQDDILKKFKSGALKVVVNVDLFGEGFDLPELDCVIMARPTQSYGLYVQQFGRVLRKAEGKTIGTIIDLVNNMVHGLPDMPREWSLDDRERKGRKSDKPNEVPLKSCTTCFLVYEAFHKACPYCGFVTEPAARSRPEQVEGDLVELDPATLAAIRAEIERNRRTPQQVGEALAAKFAPEIGIRAGMKRQAELIAALDALVDTMNHWSGVQIAQGVTNLSDRHRLFYYKFGVDVLTAQTYAKADVLTLMERIKNDSTRRD